mgnify:CR=1 FL=1
MMHKYARACGNISSGTFSRRSNGPASGKPRARTAAEKARNAVAEQEGKLAEYRENPLLQEMYREEETREAAWEAARTAVEQVGGDIRVCEKQIASCEAEQKKAGETAQQSADAARKFFAAHPLLEPLAAFFRDAIAVSKLSGVYTGPLLKCMTISILTMIGESLCKDAGQAAGACAVQLVGVAAALYAALPLMRTFLTMIGECL